MVAAHQTVGPDRTQEHIGERNQVDRVTNDQSSGKVFVNATFHHGFYESLTSAICQISPISSIGTGSLILLVSDFQRVTVYQKQHKMFVALQRC